MSAVSIIAAATEYVARLDERREICRADCDYWRGGDGQCLYCRAELASLAALVGAVREAS